ncbi:ASCH domain-containing protein [Vibrio sp. WXL103]|uniref:ASCH domain-containing protein n=1 Tax=Vibrio sp. WXL103 TaxID=3450710 RepID=UPI003EC703C0
MNIEQQRFLDHYLDTLSEEERAQMPQVVSEHFCADEYNANECARLINEGKKQATCSLKAGYDVENEPLPQVGQLTVILNWSQDPVCIVKLIDVSVCRFDEVTSDFAALEGEGDGSYEWWRSAHTNFFEKYAQEIGVSFSGDSELVLERFVKVYPD